MFFIKYSAMLLSLFLLIAAKNGKNQIPPLDGFFIEIKYVDLHLKNYVFKGWIQEKNGAYQASVYDSRIKGPNKKKVVAAYKLVALANQIKKQEAYAGAIKPVKFSKANCDGSLEVMTDLKGKSVNFKVCPDAYVKDKDSLKVVGWYRYSKTIAF